jgi:hypothetical protein
MNRCKLEDFADCYVDGSNNEISRAFQERLFSLGAKWLDFNDQTVRFNSEMTHICFDGSRISWNPRGYAMDNYSNEIEMEDLKQEKPKPTKLVKVEESIFDLKEEFERGELYFDVAAVSGGVFFSNDEYVKINSKESLCECYSNGNVYRQVEIDWRDELAVTVKATGLPYSSNGRGHITGMSWNSEIELIAICHKVAELTDKPE